MVKSIFQQIDTNPAKSPILVIQSGEVWNGKLFYACYFKFDAKFDALQLTFLSRIQ